MFQLRWVDCYHVPDKGSASQLMQSLAAAVEYDIPCLEIHATPHGQRCGIDGDCHKREPSGQTHIRYAWGIFLAPQRLQMMQLCPSEPGSGLSTRDDDGFDLCIAQARLVVIGVEERARAASRHFFLCKKGTRRRMSLVKRHRAGAEIALTHLNDKARPYVEPLAAAVEASLLLPLEVRDPAQADALFEAIASKWGRLDILVHSIAFAPRQALEGRVTDCPRDDFLTAMDVSCWPLLDLTRRAEKLMTGGGTIFAMSYYGANEVIENYGIMGPVKAALESAVRYLAAELGPKGIRVHAISPGPLAPEPPQAFPISMR
jgi:hypothetical protein